MQQGGDGLDTPREEQEGIPDVDCLCLHVCNKVRVVLNDVVTHRLHVCLELKGFGDEKGGLSFSPSQFRFRIP